MKPLISVIIPVYNEEDVIGECIDAIRKNDFPGKKVEIIVVDDGSTDKTIEICEKEKVKVIKQNHKGAGAARNLGVSKARGEIVVLIDADQLLHKNFLKEVEKAFKDKKIAGILPKEISISRDDFISKSILTNTEWTRIGEKEFKRGEEYTGDVLRACRKKLFLAVGGMDTKRGFYDDAIGAEVRKRGYRTIHLPEAVVYHYCPLSLKKLMGQAVWIGRSYVDYLRNKKKEGWMWRNVIMTLYGTSVLFSAGLFVFGWLVPLLYVAPFFLYEFRKMFLIFTKRKKPAYVLMVPVLDILKSVFRTFGMITKLVGFRKKVGGKLF